MSLALRCSCKSFRQGITFELIDTRVITVDSFFRRAQRISVPLDTNANIRGRRNVLIRQFYAPSTLW